MSCDPVCTVLSTCLNCSPLCWPGPRPACLSVKSVGRKTQLNTSIHVTQIPHEMQRGRMSSFVSQESARGLVCESSHSRCLFRWLRISYPWSWTLSVWVPWTWDSGLWTTGTCWRNFGTTQHPIHVAVTAHVRGTARRRRCVMGHNHAQGRMLVSARHSASVGYSLHLVAMPLAVPIGAKEVAGPQESCRAVPARGQESCLATHPSRGEDAFVCDPFVNIFQR